MNANVVNAEMLSAGVLLVRIVAGLIMAAHGAQKLFGWFGGYGLNKTGEFFVHLGFQPGRAFAAAASLAETVSGALVALGFLGPIGPALMLSVMIVAAITVHWEHGLFASNNGIEVALLYATIAVGLALTGYGRYSLDGWLGIADWWTAGVTWAALGIGGLGGLANLAIRRRTLTPPEVATNANRH
jgi:putative oxidoreductase